MALEVAPRLQPLAPYLRLEPGFQARVFPDQELAIERVARARCPGSAAQLIRTYRNLATAYCLNHADEGWDPATARARLREATGRPALGPDGDVETEYRSDRTLERYWSDLVEAGLIRLEKFGARRSRVVRVYLPGVLERHGGLEAHRDRAVHQEALARQRQAARRARLQDDRFETTPPGVTASRLGGRDYYGVKATSQPILGFSPPSLSASRQQILGEARSSGYESRPYDVSSGQPDGGLSAPLTLHKKIVSLPSDTEVLKVGGAETATSSSPPLDPPAPEEAVVSREAKAPSSMGIAGERHDKFLSEKPEKADPGKTARPAIPSGPAAALRVTVKAETLPERPIAAAGRPNAIEGKPWESLSSASDIAVWLAKMGQDDRPRPAARRQAPAPLQPPKPGVRVVCRRPGQMEAVNVPFVPPSLPPQPVDPAARDSVQPWVTGSVALLALEELTVERATAETAEAALGKDAWAATVSVQPWEAWLKACDHRRAYDAFHAYERAVKAKHMVTWIPDGVPDSAAAFCEHIRGFFAKQIDVVAVNGQAFMALNLTLDQYSTALAEAGCAYQRKHVTDGKALAAYLLGIARRLASGEKKV